LRIQSAELHEEIRKLTAKNLTFRKEINKLSRANESFQDLPFLFENSMVSGDAFSNKSNKVVPRTREQTSMSSSAQRNIEPRQFDSEKKNTNNDLLMERMRVLEIELLKEKKVRKFFLFYA
jgi:hypothetical protein